MLASSRVIPFLVLACVACGRATLDEAQEAVRHLACVPGSTVPCYSGSPETRNVGRCVAGVASCLSDGSGFGACVGEVLPSPEICGTPTDESCDGRVDDWCACVPGASFVCYGGPEGTQGVGPCRGGTQVCLADGLSYGPCEGDVVPAGLPEDGPGDENCDGSPVCEPATYADCYDGPAGTLGVGACKAGKKQCSPNGSGYGSCKGATAPKALLCDGPQDWACNGDGDLCAPCLPGQTDPPCAFDGCFSDITPVWSTEIGPPPTGFDWYKPLWLSGDTAGNVYFANRSWVGYDLSCDYAAYGLETIHRYGTDASDWELRTPLSVYSSTCVGGGCNDEDGRVSRLGADGRIGMYSFSYLDCADQDSSYSSWSATLSSVDQSGLTPWSTVLPSGATSCDYWSPPCTQTNATQVFSRVAVDALGNVVLAGYFNGDLDLGGGPFASGLGGFLARFDSAGVLLWSLELNVDFNEELDVVVDAAGNIYVAAVVGASATAACGLPAANDPLGYHTAVIAFTPDGSCLWANRVEPLLFGTDRLAVDSLGQVAFGSSGDVTKLGPDGALLWTTKLPSAPANVRFDAAGNVVVLGSFEGTIDLGQGEIAAVGWTDVWVARYDASGAMLCSTRWGEQGGEHAGISFDPLGNVLVWLRHEYDGPQTLTLFKFPPWP